MSTIAARPSGPAPHAGHSLTDRRTRRYESVASMVLTLLIVLGVIGVCMLMAWLSRYVTVHKLAVPVEYKQVGGGISSGVVGESMELNSPTWQDVARESDVVEPAFQDTVTAVIEAVAERQADISDPVLTEQLETGAGGTKQKGTGNRPGYGWGEGWPGIPPHMRWEIRFPEGGTLDQYARILDFFGIELGVLGQGRDVTLIYNLSQPQPATRSIPRSDEQRMYMSWRSGTLKEADIQLAQRAGVAAGNRTLLQFYPNKDTNPEKPTEDRLLYLEHEYRGVDASRIRRTVFEVIEVAGGWDFEVVEQIPL